MAAVLVIMVSIIGLGLYFGKKAFHALEERSSTNKGGIAGGITTAVAGKGGDNAPIDEPIPGNAPPSVVLAAGPGTVTLSVGPNAHAVPTVPGGTAAATTTGIQAVSGQGTFSAPGGKPLMMTAPVGGIAGTPVGSASETLWTPASGEKWFAFAAARATKVREGGSVDTKAIMQINMGTRGLVLERKGGWTKVKWDFNRKIGWTRDDFLMQGPAEVMMGLMTSDGKVASISATTIQAAAKKAQTMQNTISVAVAKPAPPSETVKGFIGGKLPHEATIIADPFARIRSEPSTTGSQVGKAAKGMIVTIKSAKKIGRHQWFEVIFNNGKKEGWTREDNLQF